MNATRNKKSVTVSFRVSLDDKKNLDFIIRVLNTNKSEFFRKKVNTLLTTLKIKEDDKSISTDSYRTLPRQN